jgi:hypothetical protein
MALTQAEINQLKNAYRSVVNFCDANGYGMRVDIDAAAPNGFLVMFHALDGDGADMMTPVTTFTSQNLTLDEAIVQYRALRSSGAI